MRNFKKICALFNKNEKIFRYFHYITLKTLKNTVSHLIKKSTLQISCLDKGNKKNKQANRVELIQIR